MSLRLSKTSAIAPQPDQHARVCCSAAVAGRASRCSRVRVSMTAMLASSRALVPDGTRISVPGWKSTAGGCTTSSDCGAVALAGAECSATSVPTAAAAVSPSTAGAVVSGTALRCGRRWAGSAAAGVSAGAGGTRVSAGRCAELRVSESTAGDAVSWSCSSVTSRCGRCNGGSGAPPGSMTRGSVGRSKLSSANSANCGSSCSSRWRAFVLRVTRPGTRRPSAPPPPAG